MFSSKDAPGATTACAPSLISRDVVITGILESNGDVQIEGRVEGHIRSASLVIGDGAHVQGEIVAERVIVRGKVEGTICARKVTLAAGCHVMGNIAHATLEVEFGAFVQGHVGHAADPLAQSMMTNRDTERRNAESPMRAVAGQDALPVRIAAAG